MAGLGFEIKRRGPANATRRPSGKGSEIGGKRPAPQLEKRHPESLALAMPAINREEKFFFAPSRNSRCKSTNQRDRRQQRESPPPLERPNEDRRAEQRAERRQPQRERRGPYPLQRGRGAMLDADPIGAAVEAR